MSKFFSRNPIAPYLLTTVIVWIAYTWLTLAAPLAPGSERYHLSGGQLVLLQLTITLPILIIWLTAAFGAARFRQYTRLVGDGSDAKPLAIISKGLMILVSYLFITSILGALPTYFLHSHWLHFVIALKNVVAMLLSLTAFLFIYRGSVGLLKLTGQPVWPEGRSINFLIPYCLFAGVFTWLFYLDPTLRANSINQAFPTYALNPSLLLFVIVIPYLIMWFLGWLAVFNLSSYARHVQGSIYRTSLVNLVIGISGVLVFTIFLQLLVTTSASLAKLTLAPLLIIIYLLIILDAFGYAFIARGASKLTKIEVVQ